MQIFRVLSFLSCTFLKCSFFFPGWEGTPAGNVTWGLLWGRQRALGPDLAVIVDSGHVSDMSAMIAAHQKEGVGGGCTPSQIHLSPPSVDNFPSNIRSLCDTFSPFRC